jgi:hypothetical protein
MFGESGTACREVTPGEEGQETPWTVLGQSLDALVADGFLSIARRDGAELKAWSTVHGVASLMLDGMGPAPAQSARAAALESLLQFAVIGLCGRLSLRVEEGPS